MATQEQLEHMFKSVDTDGSGELTCNELRAYLAQNGGYTNQQVANIFDAADSSGDGKITMEEFVAVMNKGSPNVHSAASLMRVCKSFDKNGDGTIDKNEMKAVFDEMQREISMEDVERIMKMADTDGDGVVDYNELCLKVFG